jgi:hypothetical protein
LYGNLVNDTSINTNEKGFNNIFVSYFLVFSNRIINNKKWMTASMDNKDNNKITELRTILQRESENSYVYKQTKSVNNRKTVKTYV